MHFRPMTPLLLTLAALPLSATAQAQSASAAPRALQNLAQLEQAIASFTAAQTGSAGGLARPLDRRLRLAACPDAPQLSIGPMHSHIIISCPALGWRFTAPLAQPSETMVLATAGGIPIRAAASARPQSGGAEPPLVRKGDVVTLIVPGEGFSLTQKVTADDHGRIGDAIRVRASVKAAPIRAIIISADTVSLSQ